MRYWRSSKVVWELKARDTQTDQSVREVTKRFLEIGKQSYGIGREKTN
jgi:hypothetical protein